MMNAAVFLHPVASASDYNSAVRAAGRDSLVVIAVMAKYVCAFVPGTGNKQRRGECVCVFGHRSCPLALSCPWHSPIVSTMHYDMHPTPPPPIFPRKGGMGRVDRSSRRWTGCRAPTPTSSFCVWSRMRSQRS